MADKNTKDSDDLYKVTCIHCGEQIFEFSYNMMKERGLRLNCPLCGWVTVVYNTAYGIEIKNT
jgi:ribosomal protein S27E